MKNKLIISILSLIIIGCDDTASTEFNELESAHISGTVTFSNIENWPESGDVTISLSKSWPPSGIPSGYYLITSADLNSDNQYSYEFANLDVDSTYMGVAVAWENPDTTYNSSCNKSILGAYGGSISNYFMTVDSFVTSTNLENNNFDANINYAIPNPYTVCQPPCVTMTNQPSCESQGHCSWDDTTGCSTKQ